MSNFFALVIGQSNASNWGGERLSVDDPRAGVLRESVRIPLADPVPGGDGILGSVWTRLAELLLGEHRVSDCLFCLCARSATTMNDVVSGSLRRYLDRTVKALRWVERTPDVVLLHLGESDSAGGTPPDAFRDAFLRMEEYLRTHGITAPIMVARSTLNSDGTSPELHAVQTALGSAEGRLLGPDSDLLVGAMRRDGVHFSNAGLGAFAGQWRDALAAARLVGTATN